MSEPDVLLPSARLRFRLHLSPSRQVLFSCLYRAKIPFRHHQSFISSMPLINAAHEAHVEYDDGLCMLRHCLRHAHYGAFVEKCPKIDYQRQRRSCQRQYRRHLRQMHDDAASARVKCCLRTGCS